MLARQPGATTHLFHRSAVRVTCKYFLSKGCVCSSHESQSRPRVHSIEKEIKHLLAIVDSNMSSSSATGSLTLPDSSRVLAAAYLEKHGSKVRGAALK